MPRRRCFALVLLAALGVASAAPAEELVLLGEFRLPTGLKIDGVEVGGLSALDYDPETGLYYALSDNRAERGPAHLHVLEIALTDAGIASVDFKERVDLTDEDGAPYAPKALDPEAMRLRPGDDGGFYWAHEADETGAPFVGEMDADGRKTRAFALPAYHQPGAGVGVRNNRAFESLTLLADGRVVVAHENALAQDGPASSLSDGSPVRVTVFDPETGAPMAEHIYQTDPIAARPVPSDAFATNGLVELLATPDGGFYALERAFSVGQGNTVKIYKTEFGDSGNVLGREELPSRPVPPMPKDLILTIQAGGIVSEVDNLEGMTFGPEINGRPTLVLVSDNNFNPNGQFTQFLAFSVID